MTLAPTLLIVALLGQAPIVDDPPRPRAMTATRARAATRAFRPSKDAARRLFARGQALYAKRKYRLAIAALEEALRHWDRREIHFNMALCHYELRDAVGAVRHLRAYLRGASPRERRAVPRRLRRLRGKVGVLVIKSNDANAEIRIDGISRGKGKMELVVQPGAVRVTIHRPGTTDLLRTLKARAGGTTYWDVTVNRIRVIGPQDHRRKTRLHWRWFAVAAGVAVAATCAAAGLGLKTRAIHADFDTDPSWDTRDEGLRFQTLTNVMWGVAGVAVATAAVLAYFTRWRRRERPAAGITPTLTPTGVGISGTF